MSTDLNITLAERDKVYGSFREKAILSQSIMHLLRRHPTPNMTEAQWEALQMIVHKITRIVVGDPNHLDTWLDIAGYAMLARETCVQTLD